MLKHVVMWKFDASVSYEERQCIQNSFLELLEQLQPLVKGLQYATLICNPEDTSNVDMMLDSAFDNVEALSAYQIHPTHLKIGALLKGMVESRSCIDYFEK